MVENWLKIVSSVIISSLRPVKYFIRVDWIIWPVECGVYVFVFCLIYLILFPFLFFFFSFLRFFRFVIGSRRRRRSPISVSILGRNSRRWRIHEGEQHVLLSPIGKFKKIKNVSTLKVRRLKIGQKLVKKWMKIGQK